MQPHEDLASPLTLRQRKEARQVLAEGEVGRAKSLSTERVSALYGQGYRKLVENNSGAPKNLAASIPALRTLQTGIRWLGEGSGGLDRVYFDLVNALPQCGVEVQGIVAGPANVEELTNGRIRLFGSPDAGFLRRLWGARQNITQSLSSGKIDLIAAHFALHAAVALDRRGEIPFVMHFHGPWAEESRCEGQATAIVLAKRTIEKYVYRRANRVIVLSNAFARLLIAHYGIAEAKIRVVPGSVDLAKFTSTLSRRQARLALGWPADRPILLAVRRLTERMGLDLLISATRQISKSIPDVMLLIAGKGRLRANLHQQIVDLGLASHVRLLGFIPDDDLCLAYRAADINIVPSLALEGFGLTAAEALAAGTPSMVTNVGGLPEVVSDLCKELVFPAADVESLARHLIAALRGDIGLPNAEACRIYACARFELSLAARRTAEIYRELIC